MQRKLATIVMLCVLATGAAFAQRFTQLWKIDGGVDPRFPSTSDWYRGAAYNPVTDHYLVCSRALTPRIYVLNASTGAVLDSLNITGVTGGTFALNDIEITSAGKIYASNLTTDGTGFKIYRWASETAAPTEAFSGVAGNARIGDSFDVAGSGVNTVIYASGNSATSVIQVFRTTNDSTFTLANPINIPGQEAGAGIAQILPGGRAWISRFAAGNKIDLVDTSAAKVDSIDNAVSGASTGDVHYIQLGARRFLGIAPAGATVHDPGRLIEITGGGASAVLVDTTGDLGNFANGNASGDVDVKITGNTITMFVLVGNNGLAAYTITPGVAPVNIYNLARSTRVPNAGDSLVVTATIVDGSGQGIVSDSLLVSVNGAAPTKYPMPRISGTPNVGVYRGVIPGSANTNGRRMEYTVFGRSASGATFTTAVSAANSYFAGISPLSLSGVKAVDANRLLLYRNYYARVAGTVNGPNFQTTNLGYFFQDAVGGINLFKSGTVAPTLNLGDSVVVIGKLDQFNGLTEIVPDTSTSDIQVVAAARPLSVIEVTLPAFNANPELYESRLIRLRTMQRREPTAAWPPAGGSANITVNQVGTADTIVMRIDSDTPIPGNPEPRYPVTMVGVAGQFWTPVPSTGGYQIQPRYMSDFTYIHDIGATGLARRTGASASDAPEVISVRDVVTRSGRVAESTIREQARARALAFGATGETGEPASTFMLADTVRLSAFIRNFGDWAESTYTVGWQVDGVSQGTLPNASILRVAATDTLGVAWTNATTGVHTARAWTINARDTVRTNDSSAVFYFTVVPGNVIFQEGFNNTTFPPIGWTIVDRDTDAAVNNWYLAVSSPLPFEGPSYAADNFQSANANRYIDDYLITPNTGGTPVAGTQDSLVFWAKSRFTAPGYPDSLDVRLSTTGRDTASFTTRLRYFRVDTAWTRLAFAIPQATNRYVAFRYLLYDGGENGNSSDKVCVDDVRITRTTTGPAPGWTIQTSGTTQALRCVKAVDRNTGWIGGAGGTVLRTTNGGTTWTSVGGGVLGTATVYSIDALNANTAVLTTNPTGGTYIYRTTNGGASWDSVYYLATGFTDAIKMFDANNGMAVGDPVGGKWVILRTTNGGSSWARIATEPTQLGTEAGYNTSFSAISSTRMWFGTDNSRVYYTTDGGATWASGATAFVSSVGVGFNDAQYGVAGGGTASPGAARSTDGGVTWTPVTMPGTASIYGIAGKGSDFWAVRGTVVYRSRNRGVSWDTSYAGSIGQFRHEDFTWEGANTYGWAVTSTGGVVSFYGQLTGVAGPDGNLTPVAFALDQNYPNPFNPTTTIQFSLPKQATVTLKIYNMLGQEVVTLVNDTKPAGRYQMVWNGRNSVGNTVATGVYFYRIEARAADGTEQFVNIKKMLMLK